MMKLRICFENGRTFRAVIISLALAENQIAAQIELFRKFKQGLLTYQRRAQLGQFALWKLGAMLENIVRNDN